MSETTTIFDLDEFKGYSERWETRLKKLNLRAAYESGEAYLKKDYVSMFLRAIPQFVSKIKPLYLFLSRAVDVDAGIIPGGWPFSEGAPDEWEAAKNLLFSWSRWSTKGVLYVDYGARLGLSGLRVADIPGEKVVLQPIDPRNFMLISPSQYDPAVSVGLYVENRTDESGEVFEYAEVITPDSFRTYKDGELFGFDDRPPEMENINGFVPILEIKHKENGSALSESTFEKQIPVLDQVNELATQLAGVLEENKDPQVIVVGAEPSDLTRGKDTVWFLPAGGKVEMIVPNINVEGTLSFIQDIKTELKESLPELSFDALKDASQIATETLETKLTELVLKMKRCRPNYDEGLTEAFKMAAMVADKNNINGLEPFLNNKDLLLDEDRAVLPLDPETIIDLDIKRLERDAAEALIRFPVGE